MFLNISMRRRTPAGAGLMFAMALTAATQAQAEPGNQEIGPGLALMPPGRIAFDSRDHAGLPRLLVAGDALLYRKIFEALDRGELARAERMAAAIRDPGYLATVTARRLLQTRNPNPAELARWLASGADHPAAARMVALGRRVLPPTTRLRDPAPLLPLRLGEIDVPWIDRAVRPVAKTNAAQRRLAAIRQAIRAGQSATALALVADHLDQDFGPTGADALRAELAMALLGQGRPAQALAVSRDAAERSSQSVPQAAFAAGLAAWSMGRYPEAAHAFQLAATAPAASNWTRAGAALWASRAWRRKGNNAAAEAWLQRAATEPRSFYGQIARRALGQPHGLNLDLPRLDRAALTRLQATPGAIRALMALQIGRPEEAEAELVRLFPRADPRTQPLLLAIAERAGMAPLAMRMASHIHRASGRRLDAGFYPIPHWNVPAGYAVSPALLYAIARQETLFDPLQRSSAGAVGILQLMPDTARRMGAGQLIRRGAPLGPQLQTDTGLSVELGQRLLGVLLEHDKIQGNVVRMAVGYNAGTGNLLKWLERPGLGGNDSLLMIELLPFVETRLFTQRMLYNFWIYQERLGHPQSTLEALAHGRQPIYDHVMHWSRDLAQASTAR